MIYKTVFFGYIAAAIAVVAALVLILIMRRQDKQYERKKLLSLTGNTPSEFIRLIRLRRAEQLLRQSQLNVAEVSYAVGFNNPRYFSKYFREMYGMTPSQYKDKYKEN